MPVNRVWLIFYTKKSRIPQGCISPVGCVFMNQVRLRFANQLHTFRHNIGHHANNSQRNHANTSNQTGFLVARKLHIFSHNFHPPPFTQIENHLHHVKIKTTMPAEPIVLAYLAPEPAPFHRYNACYRQSNIA